MTSKKLKIILRKSCIGRTRRQISCVLGLGLRKRISSCSVVLDTPENRGMIEKVKMMIEVQEIENE